MRQILDDWRETLGEWREAWRKGWQNPAKLQLVIVALCVLVVLVWHPWRRTKTHTTRVVSHYQQGFDAGNRQGFTDGLDAGCAIGAKHLLPPDIYDGLLQNPESIGTWCKRVRGYPIPPLVP